GPGGAAADGAAVRQELDQEHRAGDPRVRRRADAEQRWIDHPPAGARADRGAAQGARQGGPQPRRGGPRRDSQHPPRRHARSAGAARRGGCGVRRRASGRGGAAEAHRREGQGARRLPEGQGRRDPRSVSASYVAIITDGNGRWARQRGLPVEEGHRAGADTVKARLRDAVDLGVRELTVYSFSTENWARPPEEVNALMAMFSERILAETPELDDEGVRMRFIGRREGVLPELLDQMRWAEEQTGANDRITLFVAFN